MKILAYFRATR